MFINIITPCNRPENLYEISKSINISKENYRWIIVYDALYPPSINFFNVDNNREEYCIKDDKSIVGNAQRNYALNLIKEGWIYFNDDDTTIHPDLWDNIKDLKNDFISFKQNNKNGSLRLIGNNITPNNIDSHNFIIHHSLLGDTRWILSEYGADGIFAKECYQKANNPIHIPKVLSIYNSLR